MRHWIAIFATWSWVHAHHSVMNKFQVFLLLFTVQANLISLSKLTFWASWCFDLLCMLVSGARCIPWKGTEKRQTVKQQTTNFLMKALETNRTQCDGCIAHASSHCDRNMFSWKNADNVNLHLTLALLCTRGSLPFVSNTVIKHSAVWCFTVCLFSYVFCTRNKHTYPNCLGGT